MNIWYQYLKVLAVHRTIHNPSYTNYFRDSILKKKLQQHFKRLLIVVCFSLIISCALHAPCWHSIAYVCNVFSCNFCTAKEKHLYNAQNLNDPSPS